MMNKNDVLVGSKGALFINNEEVAEIKSFESSVDGQYEEIKVMGEMGTRQVYKGFVGAGTVVIHKVSSRFIGLLAEGMKKGVLPDITMVAKLQNMGETKGERVEYIDVTFDKLDLLKFEADVVVDAEEPFKFADYNILETI